MQCIVSGDPVGHFRYPGTVIWATCFNSLCWGSSQTPLPLPPPRAIMVLFLRLSGGSSLCSPEALSCSRPMISLAHYHSLWGSLGLSGRSPGPFPALCLALCLALPVTFPGSSLEISRWSPLSSMGATTPYALRVLSLGLCWCFPCAIPELTSMPEGDRINKAVFASLYIHL